MQLRVKRKRLQYKHFILISLESFRGDVFERKSVFIPHLRKWNQEAFRFTACRTPAIATAPAQAALLTGSLPCHNGVRLHFPGHLKPGLRTIFQRLKKAGFVSVIRADFLNDLLSAGLVQNQKFVSRSDGQMWRRLLQARRRGKRTFLFLQMGDLHRPYGKTTGNSHGKNSLKSYLGALENFDRGRFPQVINELTRQGFLKDTLVFIVGAHGEGATVAGRFGHGEAVREELIGVPWIVWDSNFETRQGETSIPVSLVDVAPTALGLLGIQKNKNSFDGFDHSGFLLNETKTTKGSPCYAESWHYSAEYKQTLAIMAKCEDLSAWRGNFSALLDQVRLNEQTIRSGPFKLVLSHQGKRHKTRLFNLGQDPHEKRNLLDGVKIKTVTALAQKLRRKLLEIQTHEGGEGRKLELAMSSLRLPLHFQGREISDSIRTESK